MVSIARHTHIIAKASMGDEPLPRVEHREVVARRVGESQGIVVATVEVERRWTPPCRDDKREGRIEGSE
jgi:DNA-directed RNA polymerase subunit H (RpoH/RPB5)